MFERLEFVYLPSRDAAADVAHFIDRLGAQLVFAIEAFETRVAMLRLSPDAPALLLAEHLDGDQPVMVYRVTDLEQAISELEGRDVAIARRFEIPFGPGAAGTTSESRRPGDRSPAGRTMAGRDRVVDELQQ